MLEAKRIASQMVVHVIESTHTLSAWSDSSMKVVLTDAPIARLASPTKHDCSGIQANLPCIKLQAARIASQMVVRAIESTHELSSVQ